MKGRVIGLEQVMRNMGRLKPEVRQALADANNASALMTQSEARRMIQRDPKSGITYRRGAGQNKSPTHTASAPGQAPATDTGVLASGMMVDTASASSPVARVGPSDRVDYAKHLEFGTRHMAPRPYLKPSFTKVMKTHADRAARFLKKAVGL